MNKKLIEEFPFLNELVSLKKIVWINENIKACKTKLADLENIYFEPSALAGIYGPVLMRQDEKFLEYIRKINVDNCTQLV